MTTGLEHIELFCRRLVGDVEQFQLRPSSTSKEEKTTGLDRLSQQPEINTYQNATRGTVSTAKHVSVAQRQHPFQMSGDAMSWHGNTRTTGC